MVDDIDISGDGGVRKKILRRAKEGAAGPSSAEPMVDGEAGPHSWQEYGYIRLIRLVSILLWTNAYTNVTPALNKHSPKLKQVLKPILNPMQVNCWG